MAQSVVSFLLVPLLTNNISTDQFGIFSLLQMCGTFAGVVFYFGISSALPRSYYDYADEEDRKKVFSTALALTLAGALLQVLFAFAIKDYLSNKLFGTETWGNAIFLSLIASAIGFVVQLFLMLMRFARLSLMVSLVGVLSLVFNLGLTYLLLKKYDLGVYAPVWGLLATNIAVMCFVLFICRKHIVLKLQNNEIRIMLTFGISTVIISAATMIIEWSDRYFINKFLTLHDVGVYTVGYKFASVVTIFLITPFVQIWNPIMMEHYKKDDFYEFFSRILSYYFIIGVVVLAAASFFMSEVLYFVVPKEAYFKGLLISPIIMFGLLLNGLNNFVSAGLFFERKIHKMTYVYSIMALVYIGLNYILIPRFGYQGAAWCSFIVYGATPICIYQISKKYYKIEFAWKRILPLFLISIFIVLIGPQIETFAVSERIFIKLSLLALLYFLIYAVVLTDSEKQMLKDKMKLIKLLKKIKE